MKKKYPHPSDYELDAEVKHNNPKKSINMKSVKLIVSGIVLLVVLVATLLTVKVVTIEGNQLGIMETWGSGVETNILFPKTYFLVPSFNKTIFKYDASSQVFVMNDKPMVSEGKHAVGREKDSYLVQSQEGQDMKISLNLRWRIDPSKLVSIHKTVRMDMEEKIIRPVVMRVVKDSATKMKAIDAYSGEGLVQLQASIQTALSGGDKIEGKELIERGIIVENFVIEHISLDPNYVAEIVKKQIAVQSQLRAVEEQKAAEADALVAKSKAQAEYNTKLVAQQLISTNMVIQAQAENEKAIIAAKAEQQKLTLTAEGEKAKMVAEGEGKKLAMVAMAEGTLAMGKAEAQSKQLLFESYKMLGPDAYMTIEVAKSLAEGTKGIQGYLPNNFNPTIISGNFMDAVSQIVNVKALRTVSPVK